MINLLLGAPGGGKSYEAVVFHILPALAAGRKVLTNIPLNLDIILAIDSSYSSLIEICTETKQQRPETDLQKAEILFKKFGIAYNQKQFISFPFSHASDYGDKWRHPLTGSGPLYVIDECHIALPSKGTPMDVEHWYSLHRHESADVLLITQSHGKVNSAICQLVQIVYRVRKNTAFGLPNSYTRKVIDGLRGEVVNTAVRNYEKTYFKYYKSHTLGGGAELAAKDIKPIWFHWSFIGSAIFLSIFLFMLLSGRFKMPFIQTPKASNIYVMDETHPSVSSLSLEKRTIVNDSNVSIVTTKKDEPIEHPFNGMTIHILGTLSSKGEKTLYLIGLGQNGQIVRTFSNTELIRAGYNFIPISDCVAKIKYDKYLAFIRCDSPSAGVMPGKNLPSS